MFIKRALVVIAAATLAVASFAQGGGFGGGQGRGMRMMGGSPTMLLREEEVQTELKLTDEQKSKIGEIQGSMRERMQPIMQEAAGDREKMTAAFAKVMEGMTKEINAVLTADQQKRLKEIFVQRTGNSVVLQKDFQKELKMTDEQIKKVDDLNKKSQAANMALFQKMRDGDLTQEEVTDKTTKNSKALNDEIGKILTDDQKAKLKEMAGKPFAGKKDGN